MTVLILSNSSDIHADDVEKELKNQGKHVFRVDTDTWFAENLNISLEYPQESFLSKKDALPLILKEVKSVLYRRPLKIEPVQIHDLNQRKFTKGEVNELFHQLWYALPNALWVNAPHALEYARRKYSQIIAAANLGIAVPCTCMSNNPHEVKKFVASHKQVIFKTMKAPVIELHGDGMQWGVPTTLLTERHIQQLDLIAPSGGIFQEYINKLYEIRVTIIGEDVHATKIHSQENTQHDAHIDWREGVAYGNVRVEPYALPEEVQNVCKNILLHYHIKFGAIDLIRTPNGGYVFLELNPNGQWLWIEEMTGQPLIKSMVKLLSGI